MNERERTAIQHPVVFLVCSTAVLAIAQQHSACSGRPAVYTLARWWNQCVISVLRADKASPRQDGVKCASDTAA
jgi:hypothetical protein